MSLYFIFNAQPDGPVTLRLEHLYGGDFVMWQDGASVGVILAVRNISAQIAANRALARRAQSTC